MASALLTDTKIKGIKPKASSYYVWQPSGTRGVGRLGLKIYPSGRKVFVYKYHKDGNRKFITLGDYPQLSLYDATIKAQDSAKKIGENEELIVTFASISQLFSDYIKDQQRQGKRSWKKTEDRLNQIIDSKHIDPSMPAKDITPNHIKHVLSEFISRGALAGSNKARANLHAAFNFGLFADNDPANLNGKTKYALPMNPVSVVPAQKGADKALDRFLSWSELTKLIELINVADDECPINPCYGRLLMLCIHTGGQRPWEIITNKKSNWDKDNNTLTVPPSISKNSDFHVIPLTETAREILMIQENLYPESEYIFCGNTREGHLLSAEYAKQLRKLCLKEGFETFTPRDVRRTFKTLAGDMGISLEMRDRLQNHKPAGVATKHYDRYAYLREKWEVINLWEKKLKSLQQK